MNRHLSKKWLLWSLLVLTLMVLAVGCQSESTTEQEDTGKQVGADAPTVVVATPSPKPTAAPTEAMEETPEGETPQETPEEEAPDPEEGQAPEIVVPTPAIFGFEQEPETGQVLALGDPEAPVIVVEFTDYQCPYCARHFQETWPALKEQYIDTGRVYYVVKDFPLTDMHPEAPKAAEAARCAAEQDAFEEMHDQLFAGQEEWSGQEGYVSVFKDYAGELGLDQDAFDQCLDSGQYADAVQADLEEGLRFGVQGTPTFFTAGYPIIVGAQPIEFFDQVIVLAENGELRDAIAESIARAQAERDQAAQPQPTVGPVDVPLGDAPMKGDPDAPVTIVEYSEYQCPYCARHALQTLPQLMENYVDTGQVRYVFKDFPLTQIHPQAVGAAQSARCADEQGGDEAYWEMHDHLFSRQEEWSGNSDYVALFKGYAGELGLDQDTFDECLDSDRYEAAVQADLQEGVGFGVTGVPAFFINGQPLTGAQPYEAFVEVIESILAEE